MENLEGFPSEEWDSVMSSLWERWDKKFRKNEVGVNSCIKIAMSYKTAWSSCTLGIRMKFLLSIHNYFPAGKMSSCRMGQKRPMVIWN